MMPTSRGRLEANLAGELWDTLAETTCFSEFSNSRGRELRYLNHQFPKVIGGRLFQAGVQSPSCSRASCTVQPFTALKTPPGSEMLVRSLGCGGGQHLLSMEHVYWPFPTQCT